MTLCYLPLKVGCSITKIDSLLIYCAATFLHLLKGDALRRLCLHLALPAGRNASLFDMGNSVLDHVADELGDGQEVRMRELLLEMAANRKRRVKLPQPEDPDEEDQQAEGADGDDGFEVDEGMEGVEVPPALQHLAPAEVNFALHGGPAGMALTEEEDDLGLNELCKAAQSVPGPSVARGAARRQGAQTGSASSRDPTGSAFGGGDAAPPVVGQASTAPAHDPVGEGTQAPSSLDEMVQEMPDLDLMGSLGDEEPLGEEGTQQPTESQALEVVRGIRLPRSGEATCHPGCHLRRYDRGEGKFCWEAKLPVGIKFEGKNSHSPGFGDGLRSEELAFTMASSFLQRAEAAGVLTALLLPG
jgi:hypothetical protein